MLSMTKLKAYDVPLYILGKCFCDTESIKFQVSCDDVIVYEQIFSPGKEQKFKIDQNIQVIANDRNNMLKLSWKADAESPVKFLDLYKIVLNNQQIMPHSAVYKPYETDYIKEMLQGNEQDQKTIKEKIYYPGNRFGWYGDLKFAFTIGTKQTLNKKVDWQDVIGGHQKKIYMDTKESANKNVITRK